MSDFHVGAPIEGIGFTQFYGNSFMCNLLDDLEITDDPIIRILLVGSADPRNVIYTACRKLCNPKFASKKIEFYVFEQSIEVIARHATLLSLVNDSNLSTRERVEMFLSIYGNALIREKEEEYISKAAKSLIKTLTSCPSQYDRSDQLSSCDTPHPYLDFSTMRFAQRDQLEEHLSFYFAKSQFDVESLRDHRQRGFYRLRYSVRKNLLDSYFHSVASKTCDILHWKEFKDFGVSGVAFETRLGSYCKANKTFASRLQCQQKTQVNGLTSLTSPGGGRLGVLQSGTESINGLGFWGDIVNGPFVGLAAGCLNPEDKDRLWRIAGRERRLCAYDIADYNLYSLLVEEWRLGCETKEEREFPYANPLDSMRRVGQIQDLPTSDQFDLLVPLKGFQSATVKFLTGDLVSAISKSPEFHVAFFGAMAAGCCISSDSVAAISDHMKHGSKILVETMQSQVLLDGAAKRNFRRKVREGLAVAGWIDAAVSKDAELGLAVHELADLELNDVSILRFARKS